MDVTVTTTGPRNEGGAPETITVLTGTVGVYRAVPAAAAAATTTQVSE